MKDKGTMSDEDHGAAWSGLKDEVLQKYTFFDGRCRNWVASYEKAGGRIWCARGCRNCCNLTVNATLTEALLVAETLTGAQLNRLRGHVATIRRHLPEVSDLKSYLRLHRQQIGLCPFLDNDGACGIYDRRPFSCRALLSTRNSEWCAVDFAELHPMEKQAFLSSLDRTVVAFPTHYVAATQELGAELEAEATYRMRDAFGLQVTGNLAALAYLEKEYQLSELLPQGEGSLAGVLAEAGLNHPFLVHFGGG